MFVPFFIIIFALLIPVTGLGASVIGFKADKRRWKLCVVLYSFSMAMLAYTFEPAQLSDLYRYHSWLKYYNGNLFSIFSNSDGLYVRDFLFWFVSKIGDKNVLQAIPTGLVYGCSSYIVCSYCEKNKCFSFIPKLILIQFMLFPLISIINNVRNVGAFALLIAAVYRDLFLKKRNIGTLFLYVIPCFLHTVAISVIIVRLLYSIIKDTWIICLVLLLATFIIEVLSNNIGLLSFFPPLQRVIEMGSSYYKGAEALSAWALQVANSPWQSAYKIVYIFYFALVILSLIYTRGVNNIRKSDDITGFLLIMSVFAISSSFTVVPQFWRYGLFVTSFIPFVIVPVNMSTGERKNIINRLFYVVGSLCVLLWIYKLPSEIDVVQWITAFLLNSPLINFVGNMVSVL